MNKKDLFFNKMMLGDLRLGELLQIVKIEGEYTIGRHWLPIHKTRKLDNHLGIWMDEYMVTRPSLIVSLDAVVKVEGKIVRLDVPSEDIKNGYLLAPGIQTDHVELKILLYDDPFLRA